jgi:hypothetical protein
MRIIYILLVSLCLLISACKKETNTTIINNIDTTYAVPAYVISGLHDLHFINGFIDYGGLDLTVQYMDSAQQSVRLSLSDLPDGMQVVSNWTTTGIPTFNTTLGFFNDNSVTLPGNYPITLTAMNDSGQQKSFSLNIKVDGIPTYLLGKYGNCKRWCSPTTTYTDSIYLDPAVPNKLWFINFGDWGNLVYGYLTGNGTLNIPHQVSGGVTYDYEGRFDLGRHINMSFSGNCAMDMY